MANENVPTGTSAPSGGESGTNTSTTTTGSGGTGSNTTTDSAGNDGIGKPDGTVAPAPVNTETRPEDSPEAQHAALQVSVNAHDRSLLAFLEETATKAELIFEDEYHKAKDELMAAWQKLKAAIKPVVSDNYEEEPDAVNGEDETGPTYDK